MLKGNTYPPFWFIIPFVLCCRQVPERKNNTFIQWKSKHTPSILYIVLEQLNWKCMYGVILLVSSACGLKTFVIYSLKNTLAGYCKECWIHITKNTGTEWVSHCNLSLSKFLSDMRAYWKGSDFIRTLKRRENSRAMFYRKYLFCFEICEHTEKGKISIFIKFQHIL